ncbi:iron chelate uptake ABC transporter family permease subunit [Glaesserella parasuis]|nr:iron chelate uptake ABC transporter family permease subunit [Glaesserella parasuis]
MMSKRSLLILSLLLLLAILLSLNLGKYPISPTALWQAVVCAFSVECETNQVQTVLWHIRVPRIIVACLVGAALACAGATYQGMFKNPLVSPDILGVSVGAGFGASLAIFCNLPMWYVQLFAFVGGISAVLLVTVILETKNLTISYANQPLISGIDFRLGTNDICCVLGANGAWKVPFYARYWVLKQNCTGKFSLQTNRLLPIHHNS